MFPDIWLNLGMISDDARVLQAELYRTQTAQQYALGLAFGAEADSQGNGDLIYPHWNLLTAATILTNMTDIRDDLIGSVHQRTTNRTKFFALPAQYSYSTGMGQNSKSDSSAILGAAYGLLASNLANTQISVDPSHLPDFGCSGKNSKVRAITGGVIGGMGGILILCAFLFWNRRRLASKANSGRLRRPISEPYPFGPASDSSLTPVAREAELIGGQRGARDPPIELTHSFTPLTSKRRGLFTALGHHQSSHSSRQLGSINQGSLSTSENEGLREELARLRRDLDSDKYCHKKRPHSSSRPHTLSTNMGKSKAKKGQMKRYDTPVDKYVIVADPWGGVPSDPNFFNNVTAWFEIMLRPKYLGVRPSAIYVQGTNKNIVVELPDSVDVTPYLGAHYWREFLVAPWCYQVAERASHIYEFDYQKHPIPSAKGGWIPGFAAYTKIHDEFEVTEPYPPARPANVQPLPIYAKRLPAEKQLLPGQLLDLPPLLPLPPLPPPPGEEDWGHEAEPDTASRSGYGSRSRTRSRDMSRSLTTDLYDERQRRQGREKDGDRGAESGRESYRDRDGDGRSASPIGRQRSQTFASSTNRRSQTPPGFYTPSRSRYTQPEDRSREPSAIPPDPHQYQSYNPPGHLAEAAEVLINDIAMSTLINVHDSPSTSSTFPTTDLGSRSSSSMPPSLQNSAGALILNKLKMVKKMDPYEEEEQAMAFLRHSSTTDTTTSTLPSYPPSTREQSIKTETGFDVKRETMESEPHEHEDGYTPSTELQNAFASLDGHDAHEEFLEDDDMDYKPSNELQAQSPSQSPRVGGYTPSEDLLRALSSLPQDMVDLGGTPQARTSVGEIRVKDEPRDDDGIARLSESNGFVRIKREPSDSEWLDRGLSSGKRVKLER
ncbi:hypothetical protein NP233_g5791 [Leucocoprinus birnbaumii]|uniref:Uncharacterized protein n=1 Tax=Leucocoprinus birnbaumii TaxID=56174 RepID=A0AAD5YW51_9AGAR|nr:hypothetical protein NP233_g5791 [Leucocoprinus birnbaumii]